MGLRLKEQQRPAALGAKTLRAAGLLPVAGVGSVVTAIGMRNLAALSTAKIPRRRAPRSFRTGSMKPRMHADGEWGPNSGGGGVKRNRRNSGKAPRQARAKTGVNDGNHR